MITKNNKHKLLDMIQNSELCTLVKVEAYHWSNRRKPVTTRSGYWYVKYVTTTGEVFMLDRHEKKILEFDIDDISIIEFREVGHNRMLVKQVKEMKDVY